MFDPNTLLIAGCLFLGAVLYTSVGHAGASAYIAVMTLFDLPPLVIKPTALTLNIFVSSYTSFRYIRSNYFNRSLFVYLIIGSIPAAFIGGHINLPSHIYKPIIGILLLISGTRFLIQALQVDQPHRSFNVVKAVTIGSVIGLLSGITGTGGGIFLSPLIIWLGWVSVKQASGTVAAFIFVNSIAGLLGNFQSTRSLPSELPIFLIAVLLGAFIGTRFGISKFSSTAIKRALGFVLLIAGAKFIFAP
ncbi:MAG: sulfite exporter TauE/SafE family protein [Candidatus Planktophila sp.]|nr:sulfite exporter TauE/SafE family protein [Candidatus Planktophila sp.]